jgi:hypothetical protein
MIKITNFKLATINLLEYPLTYVVSNKVRPVYYKFGSKIPKKYSTSNYSFKLFKGKQVLHKLETDKPVVKNAAKADKPKYEVINENRLHALTMKTYQRAKILKTLKDYYHENLLKTDVDLKKLALGLREEKTFVSFIFYINRDHIEDLDNHSGFYRKVFLDVIQTHMTETYEGVIQKMNNPIGFIADDNVDHITDFSISYKEVLKIEDRKIEISFYYAD